MSATPITTPHFSQPAPLIDTVTGQMTTSQSNEQKPQLLKMVTFRVNTLSLCIPIMAVRRISAGAEVHGGGRPGFGLSHLDDGEVTVVDLQYHLFQHSSLIRAEVSTDLPRLPYMVVIRGKDSNLFGIPTTQAPVLLDIPTHLMRVLPESYRQLDTLSIASHVAVMPNEGEQSSTFFVLDIDRFVALTRKP